MDLSEFKDLKQYKKFLKEDLTENTVRGKEFSSLVPLILDQYYNLQVRDFLDIDGTFAVIVDAYAKYTLVESIKLYQDTREIIAKTTYMEVQKEGFINNLGSYQGFWIQFA